MIKIKIKMSGGLGNQMFCYCFFLRMKKQYPLNKVSIDYDQYKYYKFHNGLRLAQVFDLNYPFNLKERYNLIERLWYRLYIYIKDIYYTITHTPIIHEDIDEFKSFENSSYKDDATILFHGSWGSDFYFHPVGDIVKKVFTQSLEKRSNNVKNIAKDMQINNSVFIHVRRGDYLKTDFVDLSKTTYYQNAIQFIENNTEENENFHLYIISDDPEYCKLHFQFLSNYPTTYIKGNKDFEDLYLMSQCKYAIIDNSTFSWWGAYLSNAKIICAPFYRLKSKQDRPYNILYPNNWNIIK